jgi:hypothetical protein
MSIFESLIEDTDSFLLGLEKAMAHGTWILLRIGATAVERRRW